MEPETRRERERRRGKGCGAAVSEGELGEDAVVDGRMRSGREG